MRDFDLETKLVLDNFGEARIKVENKNLNSKPT